jgi:hypothetical protein
MLLKQQLCHVYECKYQNFVTNKSDHQLLVKSRYLKIDFVMMLCILIYYARVLIIQI